MSDPRKRVPGGRAHGAQQARAGQEAGIAARYGSDGHVPSPTEKNYLGTWALAAGIGVVLATLLPVVIYLPVGVLTTAGAIVLGIMALRAVAVGRANNRGAAMTGLVLGVIGLVWFAISVFALAVLSTTA